MNVRKYRILWIFGNNIDFGFTSETLYCPHHRSISEYYYTDGVIDNDKLFCLNSSPHTDL